MLKLLKIFIIGTIVIGVVSFIGLEGYIFYMKNYTKGIYVKVKNNNRVYVYETYFKALNNVLYTNNITDTSFLKIYYGSLAKQIDIPIDIELKFMPLKTEEPFYVVRYLDKDSNFIEIIDFDKNCWGYVKGIIYKSTAHLNPPADSLIIKRKQFLESQNKSERSKIIRRIYNNTNPYGFYCKCS